MLSSLAAFLQERSLITGNLYGFIYVFYYGLLVALGIISIARFPLRGSVMAVIMVLYAVLTLVALQGAENLPRIRQPSNLNVIRLVLVVTYFSLLFSCIFTASSRIGRRKT